MNVNLKIIKLVSTVCAVLAALIVAEWMIAKFSETRLLSSIESQSAPNALDESLPEVDLNAKSEETYVDLVARPLFLRGRKPVDEASQEEEKVQAGSETFDWRLDGIFTGKRGLSALLSRDKAGGANPAAVSAGSVPPPAASGAAAAKAPKPDNYRKVSENEDVDGWRLTQIKTDRVVFEMGAESKELVLRKPKPKELAPEQNPDRQTPVPQQNSQRRSHAGRSRTKDTGQVQDEAVRRTSRRGESVDSEPEPADDESENSQDEEQ